MAIKLVELTLIDSSVNYGRKALYQTSIPPKQFITIVESIGYSSNTRINGYKLLDKSMTGL